MINTCFSHLQIGSDALHCSKSWILAHMTHGKTSFVSLARFFSFESSSNWIASVLNHLSILLKLFLSLSLLLVCWSTASREYNRSLTSSVSLSTNLMKSARSGSLSWFFCVNCTLLFHLLPTDIGNFETKVQSISGLLNKFQFLLSVRLWHLKRLKSMNSQDL